MESSTTAYIVTISTALLFLLLAALIAQIIKFEGGSHPKDPQKRKLSFWFLAIFHPFVGFSLGYFVFMSADFNVMVRDNYIKALSIGTVLGFFAYLLLGFALSRTFANGKIGNWF